jgi:hypothetical protein
MDGSSNAGGSDCNGAVPWRFQKTLLVRLDFTG